MDKDVKEQTMPNSGDICGNSRKGDSSAPAEKSHACGGCAANNTHAANSPHSLGPAMAGCFPDQGRFPLAGVGMGSTAGIAAQRLPPCRYCSCDATFVHDGFDPIYRKGIWERHKLDNVCTKKMTIEEQNNRGKWMVCDTENMGKCHFYEPLN